VLVLVVVLVLSPCERKIDDEDDDEDEHDWRGYRTATLRAMTWSQFMTILWLRWRLTRNQIFRTRSGRIGGVLTIIGIIAGVCLSAAMGVGGIFGGALGLPQAPPLLVLVIWDVAVMAFLFIWMIGVLTEIQRSESIDLARLLHLPISLRGVFVVNYLASHLAFSLIIFLPAMLGACVGLLWAKGWIMILLFPLVLSFIFQLTAWTYCLRGWLVALMVNPRRRRSVMVGITMAAVLLGQLPNLYFNVYLRHTGAYSHHNATPTVPFTPPSQNGALDKLPPSYLKAHNYVPFLWLPKGAMALQNGNPWPAILGTLGACLLGVAGLARAYRSTIRFYQGAEKARPAKASTPPPAPYDRRKKLLERTIPFVSEETGALALAFFRSLSRAPEARIAMVSNVVIIVIVMATGISRIPFATSKLGQVLVIPGAVGIVFFGMIQSMFNLFGADRDGFRALVLLPAKRRHVLLAKNLSLAPMVFGVGLAMLAGVEIIGRLSPFLILAGCLDLVAMFLLLAIAGNYVSIMVPWRINAGTMKPAKLSTLTAVVMFSTHLLFPVTTLPIFLVSGLALIADAWLGWPVGLVNVALSLVLLAAIAFVYRLSLERLGELMESREQKILQVVSQEVE
jgi:ABC-2 type transport system permease protein